MIKTECKSVFDTFEVVMTYDNVCEWYTVSVIYRDSQRKFFTRDYRNKGSAVRSYNSWVTKMSAIFNKEVSNVK